MNASGLPPVPQGGGFDVLGTWWHFTRYEIHGGVLRPAADAALVTYDPWARYEQARSGWGSSGGKAPYELLLDLVWGLRLRPTSKKDEPAQLEPESRQALLSWCAEHGLLGLLPHEAEVAHLAPRWGPVAEFELAGIPLVETRLLYQWGPNGWQVGMDGWWQTKTPALDNVSKEGGELVPTDLVPDELWGSPSVLRRAIDDASWATLPIEDAWGPFFPDVAENDRRGHFYPPPLSDEFWRDYGEPLSAFLEAATLFSETLQNLDAEARDDSPQHELDVEHRRRVANRNFFSLLSGCHPALARDDRGGRTRAFHSKSLLASLAMMAYLDLTSGKRVLLCDEDGRPFVSGAYQARYCSDRCRNRALKRAYRERHREDDIQRTSA